MKKMKTIKNSNCIHKISQEKKEEIKLLLKEDLTNFLSQAIVKIILTPHLILKIFLTLCVLGSSGLASYLVLQSIMDYFSYGVITISRSINEMPSVFPKVTLCNLNMFQTKYAYNLTQIGIENGASLSLEMKKMLGHDLKDILIECSFNGYVCNLTDFAWSWDEYYGNCYTFNSKCDSNLKETTLPGPYYGLRLKLYVNFYEEFNHDKDLGVLIRIGNASYLTYYSVGEGILASSGFQTNLAVDREFKSMLPKPYSNCEIDSNSPKFIQNMDLYNLISESEYEYTQQLCFLQCYQKYTIERFNCSDPAYLSLFNKSFCEGEKFVSKIEKDSFNATFINDYCISSCPIECEKQLFKTSISFSRSNKDHDFIDSIRSNPNLLLDFVNRTLDLKTARESIAKVNIYYDKLSLSSTTETPQTNWIKLFADIGGNLGFYLGLSVFSLFEVIEVVFEIYFILRRRINNDVE